MRRAIAVAPLLLLLAAPLLAQRHEEKALVVLDVDRTTYAPGAAGRLAALVHIEAGWHVNSHQPTYDYLIPTRLDVALPAGWTPATVTYPPAEMERFTFAEEPLSVFQGSVAIVAGFTVPGSAAAGEVPVQVTLTYQACNDTQCLPPVKRREQAVLRIGGEGEPTTSGYFATGVIPGGGEAGGHRGASAATGDESPTGVPAGALASLGLMLGLGLLGGLILNAMPCVLPVLSIKVFSLVKSASLSRRQVALSSVATTLGILVSFWALAALAVGARHAGAAVGWGVQFQQPAFVALLAVVVVLFTLNMWGLFEIQLPGRLANLAGGGPQEGLAGHFATGLFATLMATPCSAPFLGSAVSFALTQTAGTVFAIFTAVGLGMALPYVALAIWPGAARLLPRPGAWMVRLKEVMGFLLASAAIWLFYVLAGQVSAASLAMIQLAILTLALAVWLWRAPRPRWAAVAAPLLGLLAIAGAVGVAATAAPARAAGIEGPAAGLIAWVPFDAAEAERLAAAGTPVFVDVTADWCFTCKVNERFVLDTPPVADAFAAHGVVPMRADWTNRDAAIGDLLAAHGRYGIPFYMLYRPGSEPHVFGELITQDGVISVVQQAGQQAAR